MTPDPFEGMAPAALCVLTAAIVAITLLCLVPSHPPSRQAGIPRRAGAQHLFKEFRRCVA